MKIHIVKVEDKSPDWKVVGLLNDQNVAVENASVNRVDKKGLTFAAFDQIKPGADLEASLWQSATGKWYIFAPREERPRTGSFKASPGAITKAMETKSANIEKAQENKQEGIKLASAFRDATLLVIELNKRAAFEGEPLGKSELLALHKEIREWYMKAYEGEAHNPPPFH